MSNDIVCLATDSHGTMWVGTNSGGLSRAVKKDSKGRWEFENFGIEQGLPSEEIYAVTFDNKGNVWFSTEHILCSFDPQKKIITTFSSLDGVDDTMCSEGAAITLSNGNVIFGTLEGYYFVDRNKLVTKKGSLLKLRITDFFLNGIIQTPRMPDHAFDYYVPESKSVKLPDANSTFAFRFAALNYQFQHRIHYQYMLEGYDDEWQNAGKDRMATYSNLSGGTYQFKVKAFLLESPENYDIRTIEVVVPYSFTSFIVYFLLLLLVAGLVYYWYRRRHKSSDDEDESSPSELTETSDVLSEDVELEVDDTPYADVTEVGVFESVRDDSNLK